MGTYIGNSFVRLTAPLKCIKNNIEEKYKNS